MFFSFSFWAFFPIFFNNTQGKEAAVETNPGAPGDEVPRHGGEEEEEGAAGGQPQRGLLPDGVLPHLPAGAHASADVDIAGVYVHVYIYTCVRFISLFSRLKADRHPPTATAVRGYRIIVQLN